MEEFSVEFEDSIRCINFIDHHFFKKCFKVYRIDMNDQQINRIK